MKKIVMGSLIALLCVVLAGCSECEHDYDNGVITKEPTCTEEGEKTFTCSLCDETKTESVAKKAHAYTEEITKEPTCAEEGVKTFTCSLCGETKTESVAKGEHIYKEEITKEPTFKEEGEMTFTCERCGDSYTESIPVRDDEVVVEVISKNDLPTDTSAHRYSPRVQFVFEVYNNASKDMKGVQGRFTIKDLFGVNIMSLKLDFTGQTIPANSSVVFDNLGFDINQFMDDHVKVYNTKLEDLQFEYEVTDIVYGDGSGMKEQASTEAMDSQKVTVNVTDKQNLEINYSAGRYSPQVKFVFEVYNHTAKDIKGIQGGLIIKDLFGVEIVSLGLDFTGQTIPADTSVVFTGLGFEVNQFLDEEVKVYNTDLEDLQFEYEVNSIVYTDGTTE